MTYTPAANSIRWLSCRNDAGEPIPPFAVLRSTGVVAVEGQAVLTVTKPNQDGGSFYFFNGPFFIDVGGFGSCTADFPCFAAYQTADSPAVGQQWGAQNGNWALKKGIAGYKIVGGAVDGRVEIVQSPQSLVLVPFDLLAHLPYKGSASAQPRKWNGTAWVDNNDLDPITVYDFSGLGSANEGDFGVAWLNPDSDRYEIVSLKADEIYVFELYAPLSRGSTAAASIVNYDGASAWTSTGTSDITVDDAMLKLGPAATGKRGRALRLDFTAIGGSDAYYVIGLDQGNSGPQWAVATSMWSNAAGNGSTVACNLATDISGTLALDGSGDPIPVTVYLPRAGTGDPSVWTDDVIGIELMPDNTYVCITDYMDDKIGTVKMWVGEEDDPIFDRGWRIYGPSPGHFPVGVTSSDEDIPATAPGATGGKTQHQHPDDGVGQITTDPTTLTIDAHYGYETSFTAIAVLPHEATGTSEVYLIVDVGDGSVSIDSGLTGLPTTEPAIAINGDGANIQTTTTDLSGATITASGSFDTSSVTVDPHSDHIHTFNHPLTIDQVIHGNGPLVQSADSTSIDTSATVLYGSGGSGVLSHNAHQHTVDLSSGTFSLTGTGHYHFVSADTIASHLSATLPDHVHSISSLTGSVSGITVDISPNPHIHYIPELDHVVEPSSHNHALPSMGHNLHPNPHTHTATIPKVPHVPPFFGVYFIERYQ